MKDSKFILKMVVLSMLVALGVVISPFLRVEGMCPMAHFINIVCSLVFFGMCHNDRNYTVFIHITSCT